MPLFSAVLFSASAFAADGKWEFREGVGTGGTNWTAWTSADNWAEGVVAQGSDSFADLTAASGQYVTLPDGTFAINRFFGAGDTVILGDGTLALGTLSQSFGRCWLYSDFTVANENIYCGAENIVLCADMLSQTGSGMLWGSPTFRLDLYANAAGGTRTTGPVPSDYSIKWCGGSPMVAAFTCPRGSATNQVYRWAQTADSAFLMPSSNSNSNSTSQPLPVGTIVTGAGVPEGTYLKRIFPDGSIELSQAVTETLDDNALTFAAMTADVSFDIATIWPYNGQFKRTVKVQKYREEDEMVLRSRFWGEGGGDNRYLTITTDEGMLPGKLKIWGVPGNTMFWTLDDARVELEADLTKVELNVPAASRHAVLSVASGKSYSACCLTSVGHTLVKEGAGQLTVGVREGALANAAGPLVIAEGLFAPVKDGDYDELFIASATVRAGATLVVPKAGLHVGTLVLEEGATLGGNGVLEYDTADESLLGAITISCAAVRPYGASPAGTLNVAIVSGAFHSWAEGGDTLYIFDSGLATIKVDGRGTLDLLCVGGGGGGGAYGGGGGGGGGVVYTQSLEVVAGYYGLHVGAGGNGAPNNGVAGDNGGDSSVFGIFAIGGGGGGSITKVCAGGSGGGAGAYYYRSADERDGGTGTDGQGFAGGKSITSGTSHWDSYGGGGGGASEKGGDAVADKQSGSGGEGVRCAIWSADRVYGSGGGGGSGGGTTGVGGTGAGNGASNAGAKAQPGLPGMDGWGGGGGGRYVESSSAGGKGGGGIVIVRFRKNAAADIHRRGIATGGTVRHRRGFASHTFTQDGTFTLTEPAFVDVLTVGGGGGGGECTGGGGGGGGVTIVSNLMLAAGTYPVEIGLGGAGASNSAAQPGGKTRFVADASDIYCPQAMGGGAGATRGSGGYSGATGGGAGAPAYWSQTASAFCVGGAAIYGDQGFGGGASTNGYSWSTGQGGGGGGAGAPGGAPASLAIPGNGGNGRICDFTGSKVYYGGGGGGGSPSEGVEPYYYLSQGGLGGGGQGGAKHTYPHPYPGENGTDGLGGGGGGGGGAGDASAAGGNGGCGCVVIRYRVKCKGLCVVAW